MQEMLNLSQQEYCNRIEELNNALIEAWDQDQRVKALKIVIQVRGGVRYRKLMCSQPQKLSSSFVQFQYQVTGRALLRSVPHAIPTSMHTMTHKFTWVRR